MIVLTGPVGSRRRAPVGRFADGFAAHAGRAKTSLYKLQSSSGLYLTNSHTYDPGIPLIGSSLMVSNHYFMTYTWYNIRSTTRCCMYNRVVFGQKQENTTRSAVRPKREELDGGAHERYGSGTRRPAQRIWDAEAEARLPTCRSACHWCCWYFGLSVLGGFRWGLIVCMQDDTGGWSRSGRTAAVYRPGGTFFFAVPVWYMFLEQPREL